MEKFNFEGFWQAYLQVPEHERDTFLENQKKYFEQVNPQIRQDFELGMTKKRTEIRQQFEQLISKKAIV